MAEEADTPPGADPVQLGSLADSLGFLLRLSQLKNFGQYYEALGELGIRPGEVSVLIVVAENPGIRQGVLARTLMIKRAHMTKMVQSMEASGLLTRSVPDDDKRSVELRLSRQGRKALTRMQAPLRDFEGGGAHPLTEAEERRLKALLRKYLDLGPVPGTKDGSPR